MVGLDVGEEPNFETVCGDDDPLVEDVSAFTMVGGVPYWIQGPEEPACPACGGSTSYVAPLDEDPAGFNFGSGYAYLFLCDAECGPRGAALIWQQ